MTKIAKGLATAATPVILNPLECFVRTFHRLAAQLCIQSFEVPGVGVFSVSDQYTPGSSLPAARDIRMQWNAHSLLEGIKDGESIADAKGLAQSPFGVLYAWSRGLLQDKKRVVDDYLSALRDIVDHIESDEEFDMGGLGKLYMTPFAKMNGEYRLQLDIINPLHEYVCLYTAPTFDWSDSKRLLFGSWIVPTVISDVGNSDRSTEILDHIQQIMDEVAGENYAAALAALRVLESNSISGGLRTLLDWEISQRAYFATHDDTWLRNHVERYKGGWTANRVIPFLEGPKKVASIANLSSPAPIEAAFNRCLSRKFDDVANFSLHCIAGDEVEAFLSEDQHRCRVIVGSIEDVKNTCVEYEEIGVDNFADISKRYKRLDLSKYMTRQRKKLKDNGVEKGAWLSPSQAEKQKTTVSIHIDSKTGSPYKKVYVIDFTAKHGYENFDIWIPLLQFGSINDCPASEVHIALAEKWRKQYGLRLIGMRRSELTFSVAKRPKTRDDAERLAEEMYLYCPEIVEQGCDTLLALASLLMVSDYWYFWWD